MRNTLLRSVLVTAIFSARCASADAPVCGDVNGTASVSASDALLVLRSAVGQPVVLTCDQCGSTCEGDPRYLLGQWVFSSDFDPDFYEDNYDLFGVDDTLCQIVGEDLDDQSIVYASTDFEYDYLLLDPGDGYCDLFLFDRITEDTVEGWDVLLDLDFDGYCDFNAIFDEGPMVGDRVQPLLGLAVPARSALVSPTSRKRGGERATSRIVAPEIVAAVKRMEAIQAARRGR